MSWIDDVMNSDAARLNPKMARRIVEEAGGIVEGGPLPNASFSEGVAEDECSNRDSSPDSVVESSATLSPSNDEEFGG